MNFLPFLLSSSMGTFVKAVNFLKLLYSFLNTKKSHHSKLNVFPYSTRNLPPFRKIPRSCLFHDLAVVCFMHTYTHLPQIQPQWQYFLSAPGFVAVSTYLNVFCFFFKSTSTNKTELPNKGLTPMKGKQSQKQVRSSSSEKFSN